MSDPRLDHGYPAQTTGGLEQARTMVLVVYACYVVGLFTGVAALVGVIIAYLKRGDAVGTIYATHFEYQINTFWYALVIMVIGIVASLILIGWIVLALGYVWFIYRIIKGGLRALDRRAV